MYNKQVGYYAVNNNPVTEPLCDFTLAYLINFCTNVPN